jgi:membrane protein DedA with SNARE-associated domain
MPIEVIYYISKYGYLAIFLFVLLQEIGAPNPIPNEFILLSAGYMIFMGVLKFIFVLLTAIFADFVATIILHTIFYFSGVFILKSKIKWLPIPYKTIYYVKRRVEEGGISAIYIGRLMPFIRGYTSVIAGLLQIKLTRYIPVALITAIIWSTVYIVAGVLLGPIWDHLSISLNDLKHVIFTVSILIFAIISSRLIVKYITAK